MSLSNSSHSPAAELQFSSLSGLQLELFYELLNELDPIFTFAIKNYTKGITVAAVTLPRDYKYIRVDHIQIHEIKDSMTIDFVSCDTRYFLMGKGGLTETTDFNMFELGN